MICESRARKLGWTKPRIGLRSTKEFQNRRAQEEGKLCGTKLSKPPTGIKIGLKAVERFFDSHKKQETDLISIGLAVGYYYNFLDPVSSAIDRDEMELFSAVKGSEPPQFKSEGKFKSEDVRVQIIVPEQLAVSAFQKCEEEFKALCKGFLSLPQNKRYCCVKYSMTKLDSRTELQIVGLARPIMSAKRYYEDIVKLDTHDDLNKQWLKIQAVEIRAFKESLVRL